MMAHLNCTEIPQDMFYDFIVKPPLWMVLSVLIVSMIITISLILVLYRCRKRIFKVHVCSCCLCGCCGGPCGMCTRGRKSKHSSTISLIESGITSIETSLADLRADQRSTLDGEGSATKHTLYVEEIDNCSDTESNVNISISKDRQRNKGFSSKPLAFSDLLCLSSKKHALTQLYAEDKKLLSNLAYSFFQGLSDVFTLFVEHLAHQLVIAEVKDNQWKEELKGVVTEAFSKARKRWQLVNKLAIEAEEMKIPDTLQVDLCSILVNLTDHIHKTLEDCDPLNEKMVYGILIEFHTSWATFEKLQAETNLKQVKQLEKDMALRKHIVTLLYDDRRELLEHLQEYRNKQLTQLDNLQHDVHADKLHRMKINIDDKWESTFNAFKLDLAREGSVLSVQLQKQLNEEEKHGEQSLQNNISEKTRGLLNDRLTLPEFVTEYCELLRVYTKGKCARRSLELQLIGSQFSALIEHSGAKTLKIAVETEKKAYKDYLQQTNWVTPPVTQSIRANIIRLKSLRASLKKLRGEQRSSLQNTIKQKSAKESSSETFCAQDITSHQTSLKGVIDLQTDIGEIDCQQLVDQSLARLKIFEAQLELTKLSQERRLKEILEMRQEDLSHTLQQEIDGVPEGNEAVAIANIKYQREEKKLHSLYSTAQLELKDKLTEETKSTMLSEHFVFQNHIEKLRRKQERTVSLANKKEMAINALKSKLLEKFSEQDIGERIIHQHQLETERLTNTINKTRDHQGQVLIEKLQARQLERKIEKEKEFKQQQPSPKPYQPGSAKVFVSTVLVNLLYSVRHKRAMADLEAELELDERRLKLNMRRRFQENAKLELQTHETEVIVKLASALNMTHSELGNELKKSVIEQSNGADLETCSLVTKSVLDLFNNA